MTDHTAMTRRRAIGLAGAGAALMLTGGRLRGAAPAEAAATSCVLTPAKTEGPYFVDEHLNRSDIRTDPTDGTTQAGLPVALTFVVVRSDGDCAPVEGAQVDVWHANAVGLYSDESANSTVGRKYLRGYQITDADGRASFTTIYPGWYRGRAVHIHFKIRLDDYEFTSQLFFDPSVTNAVYATSAYSAHGTPDTTNPTDNIYGSDGSQLVLALSADGSGGYAGTFTVGLSGLPDEANTVEASIARTRWRRTKSGRRVLRIALDTDERVTATARLARKGHLLAHKRVARAKRIDLRIPHTVARGPARLRLTLKDADGATKVVKRTVHIPHRYSGH
jgi:protocatechuate 3,4-dioxygenase beta subunit